jgi:hypothetical protein
VTFSNQKNVSVEGDQHLFNVTVLRICIYEREYNDDDVVLLIKRAHSIGLGHSRQATEWF